MLVLTRKMGEAICIGDHVEVRVVEMRGRKVRLAIEAPYEIVVRRKELAPRPASRWRLEQPQVEPQRRRAVS